MPHPRPSPLLPPPLGSLCSARQLHFLFIVIPTFHTVRTPFLLNCELIILPPHSKREQDGICPLRNGAGGPGQPWSTGCTHLVKDVLPSLPCRLCRPARSSEEISITSDLPECLSRRMQTPAGFTPTLFHSFFFPSHFSQPDFFLKFSEF